MTRVAVLRDLQSGFRSLKMARFQEFEVMNDQRTAGGDVGHEDHLKNPLNLTAEEERVPKARKPYTISKQREKWTEGEHKRFLESLQLHGRAWRRIQEHIGSKTAVQIRSHAQKFFSKVTRESSGDGNNATAPPQIRIPPPRPKRKPTHPYPRKLGNAPSKDAPVLNQLQVQSLYEQESASPKSVLTVAQLGSETLASDSGRSPASSLDVEERCPAPRIQVAAQLSSYKVANSDAVSKDVKCAIPESSTLTLFGKRVLVNDLNEQPNLDTGNQQNAVDMELDASAETPTSGTGKLSSNDAAEANTWSPWLTDTKQFVYYLPQGEVFAVPSNCQFFSYYNGSISCTALSPKANKQQQPSQATDSILSSGEGSCTESITTSSSFPETLTQNSDSEESMQVNNRDDEVITLPGSRKCVNPAPDCLRGFVPYKRCTAESKMLQSQTPGEEADSEMTRLCL
ncbi:hypothetical protein EJB05_39567 [Eragrostis curvula]|uniref:Uncharacterized protein n=1 Tax=Eragrostis curvula TaxID=38414 RepID=A0A5J9TXE9_9POAL|nr:hypothetical protein EJB05_39567 [Eragrostis curvula]